MELQIRPALAAAALLLRALRELKKEHPAAAEAASVALMAARLKAVPFPFLPPCRITSKSGNWSRDVAFIRLSLEPGRLNAPSKVPGARSQKLPSAPRESPTPFRDAH